MKRKGLVHSPEPNHGPVFAPVGFAIPELDAFDDAAVAGEVDRTGLSAGGNTLANGNFLRAAVTEMSHHALEFDGSALHPDFESAVLAFGGGHHDPVVIDGAIDMRLAQKLPSPAALR